MICGATCPCGRGDSPRLALPTRQVREEEKRRRKPVTQTESAPDDLGLSGKVAIVTGGGAADDGIGNGRAAAIVLARAGTAVLVVDLDRDRAARTVAMIEAE